MSIYPKVPELDWLRELVDGVADDLILGQGDNADRLMDLYKYILWSRRYALTDPNSDEHLVAFGFVVKYHARVFEVPVTPEKQKSIDIAETQYKRLKREARDK